MSNLMSSLSLFGIYTIHSNLTYKYPNTFFFILNDFLNICRLSYCSGRQCIHYRLSYKLYFKIWLALCDCKLCGSKEESSSDIVYCSLLWLWPLFVLSWFSWLYVILSCSKYLIKKSLLVNSWKSSILFP